MKKQDELRGQIAAMKVTASALIDSGKLAEAKEQMGKMKDLQEQIKLLDQLDRLERALAKEEDIDDQFEEA